MATHSSILDCRIPWTEEPGRLQSMGSPESQTWLSAHTHLPCLPSQGPAHLHHQGSLSRPLTSNQLSVSTGCSSSDSTHFWFICTWLTLWVQIPVTDLNILRAWCPCGGGTVQGPVPQGTEGWVSFLLLLPLASSPGPPLAPFLAFSSVSVVAQSCPTLCDPMNRSTPGLPVHHQLPEFTQTHVHWVNDAIQPSHPLSSPSPPALNLSQHQGLFKLVSSLHEVAKVLEFQL